jgi:transposase
LEKTSYKIKIGLGRIDRNQVILYHYVMNTNRYPSDTTEAQWEIIGAAIPPQTGRGRPRTIDLRRVVDAIFYISRSGCQYRMLPRDFPPWNTVYYYFDKWKKDGTLEAIHDGLREQVREKERPTERTTASVDSQSTDSHGAHEAREFDGGKKLEGRKRHLVVDSLGLLLAVVVTAGNVSDGVGGIASLSEVNPEDYPNLATIFGDRAYEKAGFPAFVEQWKAGCKLNVIARKADDEGFVRLPIRWVVERTNAWLTKNRRLCRSYEHTVSSEVAYIRIAMIHLMVRRLSPSRAQSPFRFQRPVKKVA